MYIPDNIFFEKEALEYPLGQKLLDRFQREGKAVKYISSHNRLKISPGDTPSRRFLKAKRTLVIGVRRTLNFAGCRPSAHYQLPLATGCPGLCQYCYLHTTLGPRPYLRLYVNVEEILEKAGEYIQNRLPAETFFEGSATSDPLALEEYSGSLARAIIFFSTMEKGFFRFATKQANVTSLLKIKHNGKTHARFSINVSRIVLSYEAGVPEVKERIRAALEMKKAGYPVGFLLAPVFIFEGWEKEYLDLLEEIASLWKTVPFPKESKDTTFEIIAHRFTARGKKNILSIFPYSSLPLEENERKYKYGQFGYGKYLYPPGIYQRIKDLFIPAVSELFPQGKVEYIV